MAIPLGPCQIRPLLKGRFGFPLYLYANRCVSTQDMLPADAPEGALAVTEEQLGGRGRRGRNWQGTSGESLLFSLCLRPAVDTARLASLTPVAAEAIVEAIARLTGAEATVKQPNDILLSGRKVAGLLAEASSGRVALGIGINVGQRPEDLPERPVFPATSLAIELGRAPDRSELLVEVLERLEQLYGDWLEQASA